MDIFTQEELQAAKNHKYSGTDDSLLVNYCLKYFWNWIVELLPKTLAPNVITFVGFLAEVISFLVCFVETNFMLNAPPAWVCIFNGVCVLFYQTLDNLDGKQARRTGSSSPLGQFFDHGCDAITGCLELMKVSMVVGFGVTTKTFYFIACMAIGFLLTSWEEFCIHKFYLGYLNGADEGIFLLGVCQILIGIFPEYAPIFEHDFFTYGFIFFFLLTLGIIFYDVFKGSKEDPSIIAPSFISFMPCVITFTIFAINEYLISPDFLSPYFIMLCGLMLQFGGQMIIVAILTGRPAKKLFSPIAIIEWIAAALPILPIDMLRNNEYYWFFFFWAHLTVMIVTDIRVIFGLSSGLGIPIFTIAPQVQAPQQPEIINIPDDEPGEDFQVDIELNPLDGQEANQPQEQAPEQP
jgi:phosphatidylglycerophosphate synthase